MGARNAQGAQSPGATDAGAGRVVAGRYRLEAVAGRGGMSTVWRAHDETLDRTWAVKEIGVGDGPQGDARREVARSEAMFVKSLDHPAIPRIVDVVREGGTLYLVMDFVDGETLADRLAREGRQDEEDVASWALQLCDVLEYLHRRDPPVVYLDLKPRNIMIAADGRIRLIDFGISAMLGHPRGPSAEGEDGARSVTAWGTPGFAAPEQMDDPGGVDARADVYALGATLYALATGRHPSDAARHRPRCSLPLARIIERCMETDRARRYPSCAHVAYALSHRDDDGSYRRRLTRRMRCFSATLAAALACAAATPAFALGGRMSTQRRYDAAIAQAAQATDAQAARRGYLTAAALRPDEAAPYEGLVERYKADGVFDAAEERELSDLLDARAASLHGEAWGTVCCDVGTLYWHYYAPAAGEGEEESRFAAVSAAAPWMDRARDSDAPCARRAAIYAGIADFTTHVVPRITEGTDRGMYARHVENLEALLSECRGEGNPVIRLEASSLALCALRTHARAMRGDGVTCERMESLATEAKGLAAATDTPTEDLCRRRDAVLSGEAAAREAIDGAFCDPGECNAAPGEADEAGEGDDPTASAPDGVTVLTVVGKGGLPWQKAS